MVLSLFAWINNLLCPAPSAPEFDVSELEKLFSAAVPKPAGGKDARRKSVGAKPDRVHLVRQIGVGSYSLKSLTEIG